MPTCGKPKSRERILLEQHFEMVKDRKYFKCKVCQTVLIGMTKVDFVSNGKSHLKCKHHELAEDILNEVDKTHLRLTTDSSAVTCDESKRRKLTLSFCQTFLPMIIFRAAISRNFLTNLTS